jgi:hypothetical protein
MARNIQAVTPWVTDDPIVGRSPWSKFHCANCMVPLARAFGKCQNQVPKAQPAWHIPMTGAIPPAARIHCRDACEGKRPQWPREAQPSAAVS